ncbi:hypothetical protein [Campylobacter lanienae]|uniref:hypothetical protein n=1 Tax=Campylobacter lanienae TaxID=75658 RepID=UPI00191C761C|nr:hypothetical protein [Campylobacter lanienae]
MQFKKITLGLSALMLGSSLYGAVDLSKEANEYRSYVIDQIDKLLDSTEQFVGYLKSAILKMPKNSIR